MRLGCVIPTYHKDPRSKWLLKECITTLIQVEPSLKSSIVVCDDASPLTDGHEVALSLGCKLFKKEENNGWARNVNRGLKFLQAMGATHALVLNNDIVHKTPFIQEIARVFESDPKIEIVGCTLYYPDGRLQHDGMKLSPSKEWYDTRAGQWNEPSESRYVHHVTAAWMVMKLPNEFPEEYPMGYEDCALQTRLVQDGKRVYYTNAIHHIHYESATRGYQLGARELESLELWEQEHWDANLAALFQVSHTITSHMTESS